MRTGLIGPPKLSGMGKPLLEILEDGDYPVNLNEVQGGYQQYIQLRLNMIVKTFEDGVMTKKNNYFQMRECTDKDFFEGDYPSESVEDEDL